MVIRFADDAVGATIDRWTPSDGSDDRHRVTTRPRSARLEQIIARLDSGEAELRETLALCTEAKGLIEFCKSELDAVSGELKELELDELVDELERPAGDADA